MERWISLLGDPPLRGETRRSEDWSQRGGGGCLDKNMEEKKHTFGEREKSLDEGHSNVINGSLPILSPEGGPAPDLCYFDSHRDAIKEVTSLKRV